MIVASSNIIQMINASARKIDARVELYEGSTSVENYNKTLINIFNSSDALKDFSIERIGEQSKFFGFGICQKLSVTLLDKDRAINVEKDNIMEVAFGVDGEYTYPFPLFRVETVSRDETNNDITITAYDFLYKAGEHRVSELEKTNYTIREFVYMCAGVLGLPVKIELEDDSVFDISYPEGANFDGSETIRQALNAVAEATQTIYYVDWDWQLTFKRLDKDTDYVYLIDKSKYFSLSNKGIKRLATICHATELGDNVSVTEGEGVTQYVRENAFWTLREDIGTLLQNAIGSTAGTEIYQINLVWRGNWLAEIADKIAIMTKDDSIIYTYLLNDTIEYNGGLKQTTTWSFTEHTGETASNPITIGDALNKTSAIVDKVNKQIELVVSDSDGIKSDMASLKLTTETLDAKVTQKAEEQDEKIAQLQIASDNITTSVERINTTSTQMDEYLESEIKTLSSKVQSSMTPDDVKLEISNTLADGVSQITTTTGFTFNEEGLTISKSYSPINTQITEDGMTVSKYGEDLLIADNTGVKATNLHATTYLLIGTYSRLEDYDGRTGCFWIGE